MNGTSASGGRGGLTPITGNEADWVERPPIESDTSRGPLRRPSNTNFFQVTRGDFENTFLRGSPLVRRSSTINRFLNRNRFVHSGSRDNTFLHRFTSRLRRFTRGFQVRDQDKLIRRSSIQISHRNTNSTRPLLLTSK